MTFFHKAPHIISEVFNLLKMERKGLFSNKTALCMALSLMSHVTENSNIQNAPF